MKGTLWCLHGAVGRADDWRGFDVPGWSVRRVDLWRFLDCCPMSMPGFGRALNAEAGGAAGDGGWEMVDGRWLATEWEPGGSDATSEVQHSTFNIQHPASPIPRRVLVGYSMGARLGLHALLDGGPWEAAVLVAPHPGLEVEAERVLRRASDAKWAARALRGDWRDFLAAWNSQPLLAASEVRPSVDEGRRREVARSFVDWSLGAQEPLWERLGEIRCPVLWCVGERDEKFRALGERAVERLPRGELWVAPEAGHRVPWDAPEAFVARVGEFLERLRS